MLLVIRFTQMPKNGDQSHSINFGPTLKRIFSIHHYREGVVAQFFFVGAQIMCWTFIIQYGTRPVAYTHLDVYKRQPIRMG